MHSSSNFIAPFDKNQPIFTNSVTFDEDNKVIILRYINFFYIEQKTTIGELEKFYTTKAINSFLSDGYIKFNNNYKND